MSMTEIYTRYMYSYPHKTAYRKIDVPDLYKLGNLFSQEHNGLYIHIPFCTTKCGYCNLFSVTGKNQDYFKGYIDAVESHAYQLRDLNIIFNSLIIGGGTPLILSPEQLERLFCISNEILGINSRQSFICVETSPNETDMSKVRILKKNHVDRVSLGVQSFLDKELKILNRSHSVANAKAALDILTALDFPVINVDIIYGIPTQTQETLKHSLDCTLAYSPQEIFLYPLYLRKDSFVGGGSSGDKYLLYLFARDYLRGQGYRQLSMRRFSLEKSPEKSGCGFENTISLGAGGRSYLGNIHTCLPYSNRPEKCLGIIDGYIQRENKLHMDFGYVLSPEEQKRRYVIKNLFVTDGICPAEYSQAFGSQLLTDFRILHFFMEKDYCLMESDRLKLTPLGLSLSDYLGPMFISEEVKIKMEEWGFDEY